MYYRKPFIRMAAVFKWANPGHYLFSFVVSKHKFYKKTVGFSGIQTRIVGEEGTHADHLTTTTATLCFVSIKDILISLSEFCLPHVRVVR